MTGLLASVLSSDHLPIAELCAARLDGELFGIDESFAPIDEVDDTRLRALAMRALIGDRVVIELESAMWVLGYLPEPPSTHRVCLTRDDRVRVRSSRRLRVREVTLSEGDVASIGGMRVSTPGRILFDLALADAASTGRDRLGRLLIASDRLLAAECVSRLHAAAHLPGKRAAIRCVEEWSGGSPAEPPTANRR